MLFFRNRTEPFHDFFQKLVDIGFFHMSVRGFPIHFYQRKKIGDNAVFPVNFFRYILHEFLIHLFRGIRIHIQGIREHFHGGKRGFQLVGDIGHKLLTGIIHGFHTGQHSVTPDIQRPKIRTSTMVMPRIREPRASRTLLLA